MTKALLVPANPFEPARIVEVTDSGRELSKLVGGMITHARYDRDIGVWANDNGLVEQLPLNERATAWMREHSEAAKRPGSTLRTAEPDYILVGDIVFAGEDGGPDLKDVPQRIVDHMQALEPEAVAAALVERVQSIRDHYAARDLGRTVDKQVRDNRPSRGPRKSQTFPERGTGGDGHSRGLER